MRPRPVSTGQVSPTENANDRFKESFSDRLWGSFIVATVLHFAMFTLGPELVADDLSMSVSEIEHVEIPDEFELPERPEEIPSPAAPVIAASEVDESVTIPVTVWDENPVDSLGPPPDEGGGDISAAPSFTPYTVRPEIKNIPEVLRALKREYPSILRDAGVGGRVVVWFHIDEKGRVQDKRIAESSGHQALDEAALRVADVYEFAPALNRDRNVSVWVQFPITFRVR